MSPIVENLPLIIEGFPRVSGDEPICQLSCTKKVRFSPRERG